MLNELVQLNKRKKIESIFLSRIWNQIRPKEVIIWLVHGPNMSENVYSISLTTEKSGHVHCTKGNAIHANSCKYFVY